MAHEAGTQNTQMMMEHNGMKDMYMSMTGCHTTMYVFGFLVIIALVTQVILQAKMLKELRRQH